MALVCICDLVATVPLCQVWHKIVHYDLYIMICILRFHFDRYNRLNEKNPRSARLTSCTKSAKNWRQGFGCVFIFMMFLTFSQKYAHVYVYTQFRFAALLLRLNTQVIYWINMHRDSATIVRIWRCGKYSRTTFEHILHWIVLQFGQLRNSAALLS